jgi:hypothetical protein
MCDVWQCGVTILTTGQYTLCVCRYGTYTYNLNAPNAVQTLFSTPTSLTLPQPAVCNLYLTPIMLLIYFCESALACPPPPLGWEGGATTKCTAFMKQYTKILEATKMLVISTNDTNMTQDVQRIYQLVQYIIHLLQNLLFNRNVYLHLD